MLNKNNPKIAFVLEFASALHRCGTPSDQLENFSTLIAKHLGLNGHFFSNPTYLMISFKSDDEDQDFNHMERLEPKDYDITRRQLIDEIGEDIFNNKIDEVEGIQRIKLVMSAPTLYPAYLRILGHSLLSSALAFLIEGSTFNILIAAGLGAMVGLIEYLCNRFNQQGLYLICSAFLVGLLSHLLNLFLPQTDPRLIILAGTIALVPGLTLTMAISELANTHLASGTARLMSAMVTLLKILFGVVFATKIVDSFSYIDISSQIVPTSYLVKLIPIILFSLGKCILLNMKLSDFKWVFLSAIIAFYVTEFGINALGREAGVFFGALTVSLIANQWANLYKRSPQVFLIPGIYLLVPGRMAYVSVSYFYEKNIISGINTGFNVLVVSISIVIGLLVGNSIVGSRKRFKVDS